MTAIETTDVDQWLADTAEVIDGTLAALAALQVDRLEPSPADRRPGDLDTIERRTRRDRKSRFSRREARRNDRAAIAASLAEGTD